MPFWRCISPLGCQADLTQNGPESRQLGRERDGYPVRVRWGAIDGCDKPAQLVATKVGMIEREARKRSTGRSIWMVYPGLPFAPFSKRARRPSGLHSAGYYAQSVRNPALNGHFLPAILDRLSFVCRMKYDIKRKEGVGQGRNFTSFPESQGDVRGY